MARAPAKPRSRSATATKAASPRKTTKPAAKAAVKTTAAAAKKVEDIAALPDTPKAAMAAPSVVQNTAPTVTSPAMRKKELIDAVTAKTEHKRRDVKDIIEATLQTLGEAVTEDRELNLLPFAKVKIQRVKQLQSARVTIAKLRQPIKTAEDTPSKD